MFTKNVGKTDRTIRAAFGLLLVVLALTVVTGIWAWVAGIVGVVLAATAAMGFCPPYALLGIKTCRTE